MSENEDLGDCINCKFIKCLNLFKKTESSEDIGHELYIYSLLGNKIKNKLNLTANVCTNGKFLNASCFLTVPISIDHKESYLSEILIQVTRDFKASMFLAFSGHYRQAMQVLRCAFENIISGIYFQSDQADFIKQKAKKEDFQRLNRRFNEWKEQGRVNVQRTIEDLRRIHFLSLDEEREWRKLYRLLSKFVHTPQEFVTYVTHDELELRRKMMCPAATHFNEEELVEWSDRFQDIFAILLKTIAEFHSDAFDTEPGRLAITRCIEPVLKEEYAERIKVKANIQDILSKVKCSD